PGGFGLNGRGVEQLLDRLDAHLAAALGGELHHGGKALVGRGLSSQDVVSVTGDLAGARADVANERGEIDVRAFEPRAHGRRPAAGRPRLARRWWRWGLRGSGGPPPLSPARRVPRGAVKP